MKERSILGILVNLVLGLLLIAVLVVVGLATIGIDTIGIELPDNRITAVLPTDEAPPTATASVETVNTSRTVEDEPAVETNSQSAVEPAAEPAVEAAAPAAYTAELQEQLIQLYDDVNDSVVHIFVFSNNLPRGTGSGFLYDGDGHIVTNNHVIEGGDTYEVVFPSGDRISAELVGTDTDSDLGVLKLESVPDTASPLSLGNSRRVQVGQFVVAIGSPFGQESSMSFGIISAVGRSLPSQRIAEGGGRYSLPQVIQTDAPINPGNSGGPLLNLDGEVVGINAAIRSESGSNSGVGFSIPVNIVRRVVPALIEDGEYVYPFLGISVAPPINLAAQEQLDLPQTNGAYVTSVTPGGPAADAGIEAPSGNDLQGGDFIVGIDGEPVNSFDDLITYLVFETEVGQTVTLTVLRDGERVDVPIELGARP